MSIFILNKLSYQVITVKPCQKCTGHAAIKIFRLAAEIDIDHVPGVKDSAATTRCAITRRSFMPAAQAARGPRTATIPLAGCPACDGQPRDTSVSGRADLDMTGFLPPTAFSPDYI